MSDAPSEFNGEGIAPEDFGKCSFCGEDASALMRGQFFADNFKGEERQYLIDAFTLTGLYDPKDGSTKSKAHVLICEGCAYGFAEWFDLEASMQERETHRVKSVKMTPGRIYAMLNKAVVGQDRAKKALSIAVWQHYMRIRSYVTMMTSQKKTADSDVIIEKSNVLLIGPTGCGKTLLVQAIARYLEVPFATVDASMVTSSGYKGADANDCLKQLFYQSDGDLHAAEQGIIYIDEVDKIIAKDTGGTADVGGTGAQQTFLKLVEGADVQLEVMTPGGHKTEITMDTRNILFVASGAFPGLNKAVQSRTEKKTLGFGELPSAKKISEADAVKKVTPEDLVKYGFISEFCGRFPVIETLDPLTRSDLARVLTEPQNSLVKQYTKLFRIAGVQLEITTEVLESVVDEAMTKKTGARGLRGALEDRLKHVLFTVPDLKHENPRLKKVIVNKACADGAPPLCEFRPPKVKHIPVSEAEAEA